MYVRPRSHGNRVLLLVTFSPHLTIVLVLFFGSVFQQGQLVEAHGRMPEDAVGLSMWMASLLPFYAPDKHSLVRSRCTRRRMRACLDCAASMEEMARAAARREEKSSVGDVSAGEGQQQQPPPRPSQPAAEAAAEAAAVAVAQAGVSGGSASAWEDEGERSSRSARQRQRR